MSTLSRRSVIWVLNLCVLHETRAMPSEWLEDGPRTLPGLYQQAVHHCLAGAMNSTPVPKGWDDMQLWETMCESVIEPLSKLAKC